MKALRNILRTRLRLAKRGAWGKLMGLFRMPSGKVRRRAKLYVRIVKVNSKGRKKH